MKVAIISIVAMLCSWQICMAQYSTFNAHSHNDYEQSRPFWLAYENHFGSVEADIWEVEGELFVAHDNDKIDKNRTLDALYIQPIVEEFQKNKGKVWSDCDGTFQLLIDLKSDVDPALNLLIQKLSRYPEVFNPKVNVNAVRIVITGNRPTPDNFKSYPDFIFFDGELSRTYSPDQRARVLLFSDNFRRYSQWNGENAIMKADLMKLSQLIDSVHNLGQKIRFWNAPDSPNAWDTFIQMKADFINTDHITELADYLNLPKN